MLFEFRSRATGSVTMTGDTGTRILALIGRNPEPQGVITVAQMPAAIAALEAASLRDKESPPPAAAEEREPGADPDDDNDRISIAVRAFPLIEMLRRAHAAGKDVTWGV
jgi:hypothetical protein